MAGRRRATRRSFGSIRQLPSGRYQVRYRGPDGHQYAAPITFATKSDADAYLATIYSDIVRSAWRAPVRSKETVGEYVTRWIAQNGRLKPTTRALYEHLAAKNILSQRLARVPLADLTPDRVRTWHADLSSKVARRVATRQHHSVATKPTGAATVAQSYRLLRAAMSTAVADGILAAQPCRITGADESPSDERPVATVRQVAACADAMPERYRLLILLAAWTGIRFGELAALQRQDFDLAEPSVRVAQRAYEVRRGPLSGSRSGIDIGEPKSRSSRRVVPLPPFLLPEVERHLDDFVPDDSAALVFTTGHGNPIRTSTLTPIWHRAREAAGRPDLRFIDLRHTGQTLAAQAGATEAELRRRMGHASASASAIYLHATDEHGRAVAERLSEMATDATVLPLRPRNRRTG